MFFRIEREKQNRMSFINVQVIREDKTFTTSVYRKTTFIGVYTHFNSFYYHLPICMVLVTHSLIDAREFALVGLNYTMN